MPNDLDELREIEQLLREAEARLGSAGTFRQRTLLQMALFEIQRDLQAREAYEQNEERQGPKGTKNEDSTP
ncbi:MAG: hypothetical protein PGN25_17350 [Methylorubrum populi]